MAEPKQNQNKREAGTRKFKLPEREARDVGDNPLRELLAEARVQEEASSLANNQSLAASTVEHLRTDDSLFAPFAPVTAGGEEIPASPVVAIALNPVESRVRASSPSSLKLAASPTSITGNLKSFKDFTEKWSLFLKPNQIAICRVLWEMTYAVGEERCFSSMARLAASAKTSERQCYRTVMQLERRGFIERVETFNTASTKGTIFRLHPSPVHLEHKTSRHRNIAD